MRWRSAAGLALLSMTIVAPAAAQAIVDLPAGTLGAAAETLSRQAGVNIVIADAALWDRRVPAVRGRMPVEAAVRLLARRAGAIVHRAGPAGWRLSLPPAPPVRATRPAPPPAAPGVQGDVIVQASKRDVSAWRMAGSVEVVQAMPIGIEAGTAALVARSTIISSTYRGAGREKLFIRGIADSPFSGRLQSVTGLYMGDVRLTYSASDPNLQLYDIASIEVLQGPQGTLYGSGSMAGIIRFNPRAPVRARAEGAAGGGVSVVSRGAIGTDADAIVNLPLGPDVAVRAVGYARREGGFIDKPALGRDVNRTQIAGGRVTARWWPAADWTVDAIAMAQAIRVRDTQYATIAAAPLTSLNPDAEPSRSDYAAGHVIVTGRLGDVTLVSATGVASQRFAERFATWGTSSDLRRRNTLFTHETRLTPAGASAGGWVAGIAYADSRSTAALDLAGGSFVVDRKATDAAVSEVAVFGEKTVRVTPFLSVDAGARAVRVDTVADYGRAAGSIAGAPPRRLRQRWLLPSASVVLRPARAWTLYLRYQQGRRSGLPLPPDFPDRGDGTDERIDTVEGGVRWNPAHGPRFAASVQHGRWRPVRVDLFEGFVGTAAGSLGDATIVSATMSLVWAVTPRLALDAAITVNRTSVPAVPEFSDRLPDVADAVARAGARWSSPIGRRTMLHIDGWARYEGVSDATLAQYVVGRQGGYVRTGMTVDIERGGGTLTVGADNLLGARGRRYLVTSATSVGDTVTPLQPRTVRIGLRHAF